MPSIKQERGLARTQIVCAALELLDEVGFAGLTLRKLADKLHVKAAALYWHFESKQALIDAMAHEIMICEYRDVDPSPAMADGWPAMLTTVARTNRRALLRYRDGALVTANANMVQEDLMEGMEYVMTRLKAQGFSNLLALQSFFTIIRYTIGCAVEEQSDPRNRASQPANDSRADLLAAAAKYPVTAAIFREAFEKDIASADERFEAGLRIIIAGIGEQLDAAPDVA
jgi:AcrR family transcriptional regulator